MINELGPENGEMRALCAEGHDAQRHRDGCMVCFGNGGE